MSARDNPKLREIVERHWRSWEGKTPTHADFAYAVLDEALGPLLRQPKEKPEHE